MNIATLGCMSRCVIRYIIRTLCCLCQMLLLDVTNCNPRPSACDCDQGRFRYGRTVCNTAQSRGLPASAPSTAALISGCCSKSDRVPCSRNPSSALTAAHMNIDTHMAAHSVPHQTDADHRCQHEASLKESDHLQALQCGMN